jgi:hypothetical protein
LRFWTLPYRYLLELAIGLKYRGRYNHLVPVLFHELGRETPALPSAWRTEEWAFRELALYYQPSHSQFCSNAYCNVHEGAVLHHWRAAENHSLRGGTLSPQFCDNVKSVPMAIPSIDAGREVREKTWPGVERCIELRLGLYRIHSAAVGMKGL